MRTLGIRAALLAVTALTVVAVAAAPAHATITFSGASAGATVTASSRNTRLTRSGLSARCATSTFRTGRIAADGRSASGDLFFSDATGGTRCEGSLGVTCIVTTPGGAPTRITLRSTSSVAGTSAAGDVMLDADFTYDVTCGRGALSCTVSTQRITNGGTLFPTRLVANARVTCAEGGTATFTGDYELDETGITIS